MKVKNRNKQSGRGNNNNNASETKTVEKTKNVGEPQNLSQNEVEISDELQAKIDFVASNFGFIRQWPGNDGGDYCTITPKVPNQMPEGYQDVAEVAEEIMEEMTEIGEEIGKATFATFTIRYNRVRGEGRLIKVNDERKLTFALEVEHQVTSATGRAKAFNPSKESGNNREEKQPAKSSFGFGR